MCLTKLYYNTYSDGAQDITEKVHPCRDGRSCSRPDVRKYDRKFPFSKLGEAEPESQRSLSERQPTPYFSGHTPRGSKSPSPSGRRDSGVYMSGTNTNSKPYDYRDPYGGSYDAYGYPSRHDPRDRHDRSDRHRDREREPRLKRSSTAPHIVYMDRERDRDADREGKSSRSRSGSRDIPVGLVPLADEYGRRRRHSSSSRSRERDTAIDPSLSGLYYTGASGATTSSSSRRRTDDPHGYVVHNDDDERRRQRREQKRRLSTSSYIEPSTSGGTTIGSGDPYAVGAPYIPRRASTVVHHSDGSISTGSGGGGAGSSGRKQLRWDDQVRAQRERHNAEIANRPFPGGGEVKGILKHTDSMGKGGKGKGREVEDIAGLRRAIERMEMPRSAGGGERGRDREPRSGRGEWDWGGGSGRYGAEDLEGGRRKRSRGYGDERYRY